MTEPLAPIFLLSLPRSGSTLVQRVLGAHPSVATVSEPWVLLPPMSALDRDIGAAKYGHRWLVDAVTDLCKQLPNGLEDYYEAIRQFAAAIYGQLAAPGQCFFLDKTPRYHLIAERLLACFPDAKFIVLWRNPLATLGSRLHSYGGVWRGYSYKVDLYDGVENLLAVSEAHGDRICALRFEDVVSTPEASFRKLFDYLELEFSSSLLDSFPSTQLRGTLGDKTGVEKYSRLSTEPLERWKVTLANPTRRAWCRRYMEWLGNDRLQLMGYDMNDLLSQLNEAPTSWRYVASDLARMAYSDFVVPFRTGFTDEWGAGCVSRQRPRAGTVYGRS